MVMRSSFIIYLHESKSCNYFNNDAELKKKAIAQKWNTGHFEI